MNGNIKIYYKGYESIAIKYRANMKKYEAYIRMYIEYLTNIKDKAIVSGQIADELVLLISYIKKIEGKPMAIADAVDTMISGYLDEVDQAQKRDGNSILYDRNYDGVHDYSNDFFTSLRDATQWIEYDSAWYYKFADGLEDCFHGLMKFFKVVDNSKQEKIKSSQRQLLQYYDITKRQLTNIEENIRLIDDKYGRRLQSVEKFVKELGDYIGIFWDIIVDAKNTTQNLMISTNEIKIKDLLNKLVISYNDVLVLDSISDEEVIAFLEKEKSNELLYEEVKIIDEYLRELSQIDITDGEFWEIILYQMFSLSGEIVIDKITNPFASSEELLAEYNKRVMKKQLMEMLEDVSESYSYPDSDEQEIVNTIEKGIGYIKKGVEKWEKKVDLDLRTKEGRRFKKFVKELGIVEDILKYGDKLTEVIYTLFVEYSKNLEFLDSFERNANLTTEMQECFDEIRKTYEHDLSQVLKDTWNMILDSGVEIATDVLKKKVKEVLKCSIFSMLDMVEKSINILGEVNGESAITAAKLELLNCGYDVLNSSKTAFDNAYEKIKNASIDDPNYEQYMEDFKNCFTLYKSNLKKLFEKMAVVSSGTEKDYYYYCSSEIASMTLKDYSTFDVLSYEEYLHRW